MTRTILAISLMVMMLSLAACSADQQETSSAPDTGTDGSGSNEQDSDPQSLNDDLGSVDQTQEELNSEGLDDVESGLAELAGE